jgi:anti-sigma factor RsiW
MPQDHELSGVTTPSSGPIAPLTLSSGAVPAARLMQWIGDDEAAVDFSVLWASVVVPVASLVDWRMTAIVLLPIGIRLAQRRRALRQLMHNGVSSNAMQQALQWVENHEERAPRYTGWRARLHRARSVALLATGGALAAYFGVVALKPWEFSAAGQSLFANFVGGLMWLVCTTAALVVADAVVTPRPIFGALRSKAHHWWRKWIGRQYIAPFVEPDAYQLMAEREVELLVGNGPPR